MRFYHPFYDHRFHHNRRGGYRLFDIDWTGVQATVDIPFDF